MQITRQKIDPQGFQIQIQHTHSMRTINHTQHSQLLTFPHQRLKREPDRRNTNHHIKHRCLNVQPSPFLFPHLLHYIPKPLHYLPMRYWKRILHLPKFHAGPFLQSKKPVLDCSVDGVEVDDHIVGCEGDVVQDGVNARGGVFDERERGFWRVQEGGE